MKGTGFVVLFESLTSAGGNKTEKSVTMCVWALVIGPNCSAHLVFPELLFRHLGIGLLTPQTSENISTGSYELFVCERSYSEV